MVFTKQVLDVLPAFEPVTGSSASASGTSGSASASASGKSTVLGNVEWPTVTVGLGVFGGWFGVTSFHRSLPSVVVIVALGTLLAWSSSFQHELLHGHPTPWRRLNDALGHFTFELWLPYGQYKRSHLRHHRDEFLTDPLEDPESYYTSIAKWRGLARPMRTLLWMNRTLLGRLVIGPLLAVPAYLAGQARQVATGNNAPGEGNARRTWLIHSVFVALTLAWLVQVEMVWWHYGLAIWIAQSYIKLRSFAEHRWMPDGTLRTSTVASRGPLALIFLNNNLHTAHHSNMTVAWYRLPRYSDEIGAVVAANQGSGSFRNYFTIARLYLVRPFDQPVYPANLLD
jgi:fatty acid desaturase